MKFPNFLQFKPFNHLREAMGASELGQFEFFDPHLHLSHEERQLLLSGLQVDKSQLRVLLDKTLAFKNGRVLISLLEPNPMSQEDWAFHPAACDITLQLRGSLRATTCAPIHAHGKFQVCGDCLQLLHYKGFDAVRNRHRHYSQRLHEEFNLEEFFRQFPAYPLSALTHTHDVVI